MSKFIYLISNNYTNSYKIGISKNPEQRIKQLQTGNDTKIKILKKVMCENYNKVESALHNKYNYLKINGEWFELSEEIITGFEDECKKLDQTFKTIKNFKL